MEVTLDFETRSEVDVRKVGAYAYATHPSTDVMCLMWMVDDGPAVRMWHPGWEDTTPIKPRSPSKWARLQRPIPRPSDPKDLFELAEDSSVVFEAHNAMFERLIWTHVMVRKYGFPERDPNAWRCSAAMAASFSLPRALEKAVLALGLPQEKDVAGNRVMLKMTKPRKATKADPDTKWHSERKDILRLFKYCVQDVRAERALSKQLRHLPPSEHEVWALDQKINMRGMYCDRALATKALELVDVARGRADREIRQRTGDKVLGTTKRVDLLKWLHEKGRMDIQDTQAATLDAVLGEAIEDEDVERVLTLWRSMNRSSVKKYEAMLTRITDDNRLRDLLMYYGADTGRWAGRGVQPQNFPRNCPDDMNAACQDVLDYDYDMLDLLWGDPMILLSGTIRGAMCAAPGHDLLSADFSAIEARGTFWIAGHEKGLQMFRDIDGGKLPGQDIYTLMASDILGRTITKKDKDDRQVWGKVPVLGCDYQMGPPKLVDFAASMNTFVELEQAEQIVAGYRKANAPVVKFWKDVEKAAIEAVRRGDGGKPVVLGRIMWAQRGRFLHCKLPSGRFLSYCDPEIKPKLTPWGETVSGLSYYGTNSYTRKWCRQHTYGGKLTENIVQALCRDLMAGAMVRADAEFPIVLTVHDEIVSEIEETRNADALSKFETLMATPPAWADGFPIAAEGWRGKRYRK